VCPSKTHKAQTLLNKCKPIKLGGPVVGAQGKAVVTGAKHGKGKKGTKKYFPDDGWDTLSAYATPKPIESWKKGSSGKSDEPILSAKTVNTIKSFSKTTTNLKKSVSALQKCDENGDDPSPTSTIKEEGSSHSQYALGRPKDHHPEIVRSLDGRTSDCKVDATFVVPGSEQALPDLMIEGHLCGLQVCHPEQMGEFDYTHGKQQIAGTVRVS